jgi:hypothetical protein
MKWMARCWPAVFAMAVVVTIPGRAVAAETLTAAAKVEPSWRLEAGASYVSTSDFGGWGVGLRGGKMVSRYVLAGLAVDTGRLHAEGPYAFGGFIGTYSQTFQSTLVAAFMRFQLPLRLATPYAEVAAGAVWVHRGEERNTQCYYDSGVGGGLALGIDVPVTPAFGVGLRGGVRNPGLGGACGAVGGPRTFQHDWTMLGATLTASYRW